MTLQKTILLILSFVLLLSCKDDDNSVSSETNNTLLIDGNSFIADISLKTRYSGYYEIVISTEDFTPEDFTGAFSFFGVLISSSDGTIIPGKYTFSEDSASDYDPSIHFFDAEAGKNLEKANGEIDISGDNYYQTISDGEVLIEQIGSEYKITFDVNFGNTSVIGSYKGEIQM